LPLGISISYQGWNRRASTAIIVDFGRVVSRCCGARKFGGTSAVRRYICRSGSWKNEEELQQYVEFQYAKVRCRFTLHDGSWVPERTSLYIGSEDCLGGRS